MSKGNRSRCCQTKRIYSLGITSK